MKLRERREKRIPTKLNSILCIGRENVGICNYYLLLNEGFLLSFKNTKHESDFFQTRIQKCAVSPSIITKT